MRNSMYRTALTAAALLAGAIAAAPARAAVACWSTTTILIDGGTSTIQMGVVVSSALRQMSRSNAVWCTHHRTSIGGGSTSRIIERPKLGVARAAGHIIAYRGDRVGQDRFVVEHSWFDWSNNRRQKGKLIFDVKVSATPF